MVINDECNSWYDRVGNFLLSFWNKRKEICVVMDQHVRSVRPTPLQIVKLMASTAMAVECE